MNGLSCANSGASFILTCKLTFTLWTLSSPCRTWLPHLWSVTLYPSRVFFCLFVCLPTIQGRPATFFCKITIRRSKYHLKSRAHPLLNPCPEWIHRFIWSNMIRVISDHWSLSGSSQRNAPLEMFQILLFLGFHMTVPKIKLGIIDSSDFLLSRGITYAKPLYFSKCLVPKGLILRFAIELFKDCPK